MNKISISPTMWRDAYYSELDIDEKLAFIYYFSNEHVNLIGCYKLTLKYQAFELGLDQKRVQEIQEKFHKDGKIFFIRDYVIVKNFNRYNPFGGPKFEKGKSNALSELPEDVQQFYLNVDNYVDSEKAPIEDNSDRVSIGYTYPFDTFNSNSNSNSNNNNIKHVELVKIVNEYNRLFNKNIQSIISFEKNFKYWYEVHGTDKILHALENARRDKFWRDKMTLTILFRRKNTNHEPVDYIEDLSNRENAKGGNIVII